MHYVAVFASFPAETNFGFEQVLLGFELMGSESCKELMQTTKSLSTISKYMAKLSEVFLSLLETTRKLADLSCVRVGQRL